MIQATNSRTLPLEYQNCQLGKAVSGDTYVTAKVARSLNKKVHGTIVRYIHGYVVYEKSAVANS